MVTFIYNVEYRKMTRIVNNLEGGELTLISLVDCKQVLQLQLPQHTGHASAISSSFK
jgi:hypothetical protein